MTETNATDIQLSANSISEVINAGNLDQAYTLWNNFHNSGETLVVREAYDRLIALQLEDRILQDGSQLNTEMLTQLSLAKTEPRIPSEDEMAALTAPQKFDVYNGMARIGGNSDVRDALDANQRVILGLRNETPTTANKGQGLYDDRIIVLQQNADGTKNIEEFNRASTDPTAQYDPHYSDGHDGVIYRRNGTTHDSNNDGTNDLGRLAAGTYPMIVTTHPNPTSAGTSFALRPADNATGTINRDTNGDGNFNDQDINGNDDLNNSMKLHSGSRSNTDSAGCNTVHPDDYRRFERTTNPVGSPQEITQYVLSDTNEASHIERARNQNIEAMDDNTVAKEDTSLRLNTGNETIDLLLANLNKSLDNPNGFDISTMMASLNTQEGQAFTANIENMVAQFKVAETTMEHNSPNQSPNVKIS